MTDMEKEITENRQRIIAMENCIKEIKQDNKEIKDLIQNHLLRLVPPSFMWIFSILSCLLGIAGGSLISMIMRGG